MPSLLQSENQKFWPFYQRLLIDLFKFQAPALREPNLTNPSKALYDGTLRLLLVILHDFPEFLCDYHFSLIDILPENCIQMRNLIQSAFPRNMRLPDPFTTSLRVDLLPEIHQAPRILSDYTTVLVSGNLKQDIDTYIAQRTPTSFASDLKNRLGWSDKDGIVQYNSSLINSVVLYIAVQATAQHTSINDEQIAASSAKDIFQTLLSGNIDTRGRYLILSAMANQLRYSNSHTHFFSVLLLSLFEHAEKPVVQEQITRYFCLI
jgi:CCR4-NOT transcription complex subunit 1